MNGHWQSSKKPLYVRLVWRKDTRHAILLHEENKKLKNRQFSLQTNISKAHTSEPSLYTCLPNCQLESCRKNSITVINHNHERSKHPSSVTTRRSTVKSTQKAYYSEHGTNRIEDKELICCNSSHQTEITFTDQIVNWLATKSGNLGFMDPTLDDNKENSNTNFWWGTKRRPSTSYIPQSRHERKTKNCAVLKSTRVTEAELLDCEYYATFTRARPQLHVFVPIVEESNRILIPQQR